MEKKLNIKKATDSDLNDVLRIETEAFGHSKESNLVNGLLNDDSAKPLLSLLAIDDDEAVGHILFTKVRITGIEGIKHMIDLISGKKRVNILYAASKPVQGKNV